MLDQEIIEALREQLDQSGTRITPEAVAKLLVDNGQLTHFQATKLIGELRSGEYETPTGQPTSDDSDLIAGVDEAESVVEEVTAVEAVEVVATPAFEAAQLRWRGRRGGVGEAAPDNTPPEGKAGSTTGSGLGLFQNLRPLQSSFVIADFGCGLVDFGS